MDVYEQNQWKMYQMVHSVCEQEQALWTPIIAFGTSFGVFSGKMGLIQDLEHKQTQLTIGKSEEVEKLREQVAKSAKKIVSGLRVYSRAAGNATLEAAMNIPLSRIEKSKPVVIMEYLDRILSAANTHAAQLANFGVTPQMISVYEAERNQLNDLLGTPRMAIIDRKQVTAELKELISEISTILRKELDPLVDVMKDDHPKFWQRYQNARVIVDYKGKKNKKNPGEEGDDDDDGPAGTDNPAGTK